ncbi:MAG: glycosyltransferase [Thermoguttaceae bacterium]|nr:glycosyltransferase [Thermoguttaceae bacterium]
MGDKIETCVQSLMNQTYQNIEIILVDDGSKDDSYERCQRLAANDSRIVAIHTENRGSGPARNTGIENASGRYVYFPDADDYLDSKAIEILVDAIKGGDCDLVVFGFRSVNQIGKEVWVKKYNGTVRDGAEIRSSYVPYMTTISEYGIQGAPWNKFFDLNVIREHTLTYPPLRRHQDEGFIARYMCHTKRVRFIEDVLYTYYVNDLQKEWQKYPVDYLDAVIGLYETRKETILTWNKDDTPTRDMIVKEYINNVIKALELSFSPKMNFNKAQRKKWIVAAIAKSGIEAVDKPACVGRYQSIILALLKKKKHRWLYNALYYKTAIQKNEKLYNFLRRR